MINIGYGVSISALAVASVRLRTDHYMNGSCSYIVIELHDGTEFRREHGHGIDIYKIKEEIEKVVQ